ncbi:MAG: porin [Planctomycetota bacterium]
MKSKRAALWLALGGLGGLMGGASLSPLSAADSFVSEASYQNVPAMSSADTLAPVGFFDGCGDGGCDECMECEPAIEPDCGCETSCDCQCEEPCGCDTAYGCDSAGGCDDGGCGGALPGLFDCDLGDAFSLFGEAGGYTIGGWVQTGYHTAALPLFNDRPDEYNLHQAWLYAEKSLDTSNGLDFGGRIDYLYGIDSGDTQAFGIDNDHWDNDWDNGAYGHALPQVYGEVGYGDISVKIGHFYTIIGWEVVGAPDNFFYSHAYTMYNSEPFTHTGALATAGISDDLEVYGGYVLGWDSGFEDNGDAFLGGASLALSDDITLIYATVGGRFDDGDPGVENGYMHSIVTDVTVTDQLQYIFQSDLLETENAAGETVRSTFGVNQYLIYTVSDCLAFGGRFEWYSNEGVFDDGVNGIESDIYALTSGVNYKPHANVIVRPEVRWDWVSTDSLTPAILEDGDDSQFTFGMDTIFLF